MHARAEGEADPRRRPYPGRGREPFHGTAVFEYHARTEEAYAAHYLRRDTRRVCSARSVEYAAIGICKVGKAVFGHYHYQRRRAAHYDVRAYPGLLEALRALKAYARPAEAGRQYPDQKVQVLHY